MVWRLIVSFNEDTIATMDYDLLNVARQKAFFFARRGYQVSIKKVYI